MEPTQEKIEHIREKGYRPDVVFCVLHNKRLLLVYKAEHKLWQIPQGGIDHGETPEQAILRELSEELGSTFASQLEKEYTYFGEDFITFHPSIVKEKQLYLDEKQTILMKGKHYFLYAIQSPTDELVIEETQFDEHSWNTYADAMEKAETIYQAKKRLLTINTIRGLQYKGLLDKAE